MIYLNFSLRNPWNRGGFDNLWNKSWIISGYKYLEVEVTSDEETVLKIQLSLTARQDHAGLTVELGLLGRSVHFSIYDTRHWDTDKNTWVTYENNNTTKDEL